MARRARDPKLRESAPYEYRVVRPDGTERWILAYGQAIFNRGKAVRYLGTVEDITVQKNLSQALAASNARLELAMSSGRLGVWEYKSEDERIVGSPELNELLGFPRDRQVSSDEYRARCAEGEAERFRQLARDAIERGESVLDAEVRFALPDGASLWLLMRADFISRGPGKLPDCLGVAVDITARKQSEEHLMLVMGELNHRVKNALAVVQSLSAQTYRSSSDPKEAHSKFEGRLQALARAHDVLTNHDWREADIKELIIATIVPHTGPVDKRLHLAGRPLMLAPQYALGLSMVFHELATNALKYGALSNDDGLVSVEWQRDQAPDGVWVAIRWHEEGGPPVSPPQQQGFGLKMIERSLAGLNGVVEVRFDPAGLRCSLRMPLTQAARSPILAGRQRTH